MSDAFYKFPFFFHNVMHLRHNTGNPVWSKAVVASTLFQCFFFFGIVGAFSTYPVMIYDSVSISIFLCF